MRWRRLGSGVSSSMRSIDRPVIAAHPVVGGFSTSRSCTSATTSSSSSPTLRAGGANGCRRFPIPPRSRTRRTGCARSSRRVPRASIAARRCGSTGVNESPISGSSIRSCGRSRSTVSSMTSGWSQRRTAGAIRFARAVRCDRDRGRALVGGFASGVTCGVRAEDDVDAVPPAGGGIATCFATRSALAHASARAHVRTLSPYPGRLDPVTGSA